MAKSLDIQLTQAGRHLIQSSPVSKILSLESFDKVLEYISNIPDKQIRSYGRNYPIARGPYSQSDIQRIRAAYESRLVSVSN